MSQEAYFPQSERAGGWPIETDPSKAGMIPGKLDELREWAMAALESKHNAGVIVRHGRVVCEWAGGGTPPGTPVEIKSAAKALAILCVGMAIDDARAGRGPSRVTPTGDADLPPLDYESHAYDYIPEGHPLSDPRKAGITVRQLMHHVAGILPECTGVTNYPPEGAGFWEFVLGMDPSYPTARLYAEPGTKFLYGTYDIRHLSLILRTATGKELDDSLRERIFAPCGIEEWRMDRRGGDGRIGPHADIRMYMSVRDFARVGYLMLRQGVWNGKEILPRWLIEESLRQPFPGIVPEGFTYHWLHKRAWWPDCVPDDLYYTSGAGMNECIIIPSLDMVVARVGTNFRADVTQLLRDLVVRAVGAVDGREPRGGDNGVVPTSPPPEDESRPSVSVTSPREGETVTGEVEIAGTACDADEVALVEVDIDGCGDRRPAVSRAPAEPEASCPAGGTSGWRFVWDTRELCDGPHKILVRAFDRAGNASRPPQPLTVNVANGAARTATPVGR